MNNTVTVRKKIESWTLCVRLGAFAWLFALMGKCVRGAQVEEWSSEVIEWGGRRSEPDPEQIRRRLEMETGVITGERNRSGQAGQAANRARWTGGGGA